MMAPMFNTAHTWGAVAPVLFQSLALSLGLIVAIGAQNAFVLRQGLRREHVTPVVAFCALADATLIAAGVLGMAQALGANPGLAQALAVAGVVFLVWYGWQAWQRAGANQGLEAATPSAPSNPWANAPSAARAVEMPLAAWCSSTARTMCAASRYPRPPSPRRAATSRPGRSSCSSR